MNGQVGSVLSQNMKLVEPAIIKKKTVLQTLIRNFYPVWISNMCFRVLKKGKILDKELFQAVLNGMQIDLLNTVRHENK